MAYGCKDLDTPSPLSFQPALPKPLLGRTARRLTRSHDCIALSPTQTRGPGWCHGSRATWTLASESRSARNTPVRRRSNEPPATEILARHVFCMIVSDSTRDGSHS